MSKKIRDYIFYLFIIVFVVGTTLISLFASGYKFNLIWPLKANRFIIKTGMIAVDTVPRGATVYLNDKPQSNFSLNPFNRDYLTTAAKIKNVLPGEYNLRLERPGYWPFQKIITVFSGQTTFAENINLYRHSQPQLLMASDETEVQLSASRKYLYISAIKKIVTLKNGEARIISGDNIKSAWLKNSDKLLASGNIFGINPVDDINYVRLIGSEAYNWHLEENNDRLYYQNKSSIAYLKTANQTSVSVISGENYLAYEPRAENLFFISTAAGKTFLKKYSLSSQKTESEVNLPAVGQYDFRSDEAKTLVLYDSQNKTLYLFNPDDLANGIRTINNVISWQWFDDNTLLYNNTWEIYRLNLKTGASDLLTRVGEEITKIIWNGEDNYLIFSTANSLNALDININSSTKIFQGDKIFGIALDEKNKNLYFWAQIGVESGIYKIILQ